jgi:hypothetical protein
MAVRMFPEYAIISKCKLPSVKNHFCEQLTRQIHSNIHQFLFLQHYALKVQIISAQRQRLGFSNNHQQKAACKASSNNIKIPLNAQLQRYLYSFPNYEFFY